MALTVNANVDAALDPQLLLAVTDNVPLVAVSEKLIVAVAVVPLVIVALFRNNSRYNEVAPGTAAIL